MEGVKLTGNMATVFAVVVGLLGMVIIHGPMTDAATSRASQTYTATTAALTQTLNGQFPAEDGSTEGWGVGSFYTTTKGITISPSTGCGTLSSYNAETNTASIGSGTEDTACTISWVAPIADTTQFQIFVIIPFFILLGVVSAALYGASRRAGLMGMGSAEGAMQTVVEVLVIVIMIPIVLAFQSQVRIVYTPTPAFIGVTTALSLVIIGYLLQLLGAGIGTVRGHMGGGDSAPAAAAALPVGRRRRPR